MSFLYSVFFIFVENSITRFNIPTTNTKTCKLSGVEQAFILKCHLNLNRALLLYRIAVFCIMLKKSLSTLAMLDLYSLKCLLFSSNREQTNEF